MTTIVSKLGMAAAALLLSASVSLAQSTAPTPATPATTTPAAKAPAAPKTTAPAKNRKEATTPEGKECSAQADAKNLHGKERQTFRRKCAAELKKAAKSAPATKS